MSQWRKSRQTGRNDRNQPEIVKALRKITGVTVQTGHDDILIGYKGRTFWIEIKEPGAVSKRTGQVKESEIKPSQKDLRDNWMGHYSICWTLDQILDEIGICSA